MTEAADSLLRQNYKNRGRSTEVAYLCRSGSSGHQRRNLRVTDRTGKVASLTKLTHAGRQSLHVVVAKGTTIVVP